ncbi:MAG: FHA domain-containing protein [Trueperella sp.]|nr:FHA domain-containing protein [Trueperella sp.]
MSTLVITLLRFGLLALLWIFVMVVVVTVRNDVFGQRVQRRKSAAPAPHPVHHSAPASNAAGNTVSSLVVTAGPLAGTTLPLNNSTITVGRSPDCTLVLDDGFASSRHARLVYQNGDWYIEDLDSTNGTYVGKQRINQPTRLTPGLAVTIGKTKMELR